MYDKTMAKIKGFYINLEAEKEREKILIKELSEKGRLEVYSRFSAIEGDKAGAEEKGLSKGEDGLWKSWIKLLENVKTDEKNFDYIHIIEDDVIISDEFYKFQIT